MRRTEKEIVDIAAMESIIRQCPVCRVGMCRDNLPYIVPFSFGYKDHTVYVHCAREGMKLDILGVNNCVCVEFETGVNLITTETPCNWGMAYRSVIAFGQAFLVDDIGSKRKALDIIMRHYTDKQHFYSDQALDAIIVIRIEIDRVTGKQSGY